MTIENNTYFGEYKGTIDLITADSIATTSGNTHIPLQEFLQQNKLYAGEKQGVITVREEQTLENVDEKTAEYLLNNVGKVMIPITSEIAVKDSILDADLNYSIFKTSPEGKSITNYGEYALVGTQSLISFSELLEAINQYRKISGYKSDREVLISKNGESNELAPTEAIANAALLRSDGERGQFRQIISKKKAGALLGIGALCSKNMRFALAGFLNPLNTSGHKDIRWLELVLGDKRIGVGVINGEHHWVTYENGKLISHGKLGIKGGAVMSFNSLYKAAFGNDYNEKNIPEIYFRAAHDYKKDGETVHYEHNYSTNWVLSYAFENLAQSEIDNIVRISKNNIAKYGLFLDDKGVKDSVAPNSYYSILDPGDRTYYVRAKVSARRRYVINLGNKNVKPKRQTPPVNTKSTLQQFLDSKNLGIKATSIEDANLQLKRKVVNWKFYQIIEENGNYKLIIDSDFNGWFAWKTGGLTPTQNEIDWFNTKNRESDFYFDDAISVLYDKKTRMYTILKSSPEKKTIIEKALYYTGEKYITYRLFDTVLEDRIPLLKNVINTIKSDFEIAENIAKFEEIIDC